MGKSLRLPDGRNLGYEEYGRRDGTPVIAMHGTPGARVSAAFSALHQMAQHDLSSPSLRILALERPGYGLSDPKPGRTLQHVVEDTVRFADALGLESFALFGASGGAPFALACAAHFPDRVSKTAIAAGLGPVYLPELRDALSVEEQAFLHAGANSPESIAAFTGKAQMDPAAFVQQFLARMPETDRKQIPEPMLKTFIAMVGESTKYPDGMIDDYRSFSLPWDISFEKIKVPVRFWHSDSDRSVPISHSEYLASIIPDAVLTRLQGVNHLATTLSVLPQVAAFLAP